ncbi:MAG TPA: hypothetical protein VJM07_12035 [Gaiella sp.]|nr:hypothetical protein [Gaiella sp.]
MPAGTRPTRAPPVSEHPIAAKSPRAPGGWAGRSVLAEDWDSAVVSDELDDSFEAGSVLPGRDDAG